MPHKFKTRFIFEKKPTPKESSKTKTIIARRGAEREEKKSWRRFLKKEFFIKSQFYETIFCAFDFVVGRLLVNFVHKNRDVCTKNRQYKQMMNNFLDFFHLLDKKGKVKIESCDLQESKNHFLAKSRFCGISQRKQTLIVKTVD